MSKFISVILAAVFAFSIAACGSIEPEPQSDSEQHSELLATPPSTGGQMIGVSMPTKDFQRWNQDGSNMKQKLLEAGYMVNLQYANNERATQATQIANMIMNGCEMLIIAPVDGDSLASALAKAKENNIPVVAYDRLIMNTDAVSYYATFDNYMVGTMQGEYIRDRLGLDNNEGPFNIELIAGSPDDNNAHYFFGGAMDVLQPYIDRGRVVIPSGQTSFEDVSTFEWSAVTAQARMEKVIAEYYATGKKLDAVLASNDSTALGARNALLNAGWPKDGFPIITGQDCDVASVKNMIEGTQAMSIFKDTRTLADKVVDMVKAVQTGVIVEVNDTKTYDNGVMVVPTYLCSPVFVTVDNYKEMLIDSGYYTEDQLK